MPGTVGAAGVTRICLALLVVFLLKNVFDYLQSVLTVWVEQAVIRDLRNEVYGHMQLLSLSFFRDEAAVAAWRNLEAHRVAQAEGRAEVFADYRLRIAGVIRDYGMSSREQAPSDSRAKHDASDAPA